MAPALGTAAMAGNSASGDVRIEHRPAEVAPGRDVVQVGIDTPALYVDEPR